MQSELKEESQKIKNEIKKFFEENKIDFIENENSIKIKGELFYVIMLRITEISVKIKTDKYIKVTYGKEKIYLTYEEVYPKEIEKKLEIQKSEVQTIYFTDNNLVILF